MRDASIALTEAPKKRARKGRRFGRKVMMLAIGGGVALVGSEKLRSKVLDTLFGAEEEFQYTPPAGGVDAAGHAGQRRLARRATTLNTGSEGVLRGALGV